jgi:SagB-type dehydrogenase family enzyme
MVPFPWSRKPAVPERPAPTPLEIVRAYHQATKHSPMRFADGPHDLDWANQPDPFRRWDGAPRVALERLPPVAGEGLRYTQVWRTAERAAEVLDARSLSQLFYDAFALSAWKQYGEARWALRVNPSSGNLHPTEVHLFAPAIAGVSASACVAHYAPREHALELRAELDGGLWAALARGAPEGTLFVALTSIHWREAWKYGERAWRYCQHDAGHAMAALSLSAAALGWRARPVEAFSRADLERLLGLEVTRGPEAEVPDVLVAVGPAGAEPAPDVAGALARVPAIAWRGTPSALSAEHVAWDVIGMVSEAADSARGALEPRNDPPERASEAPAGPPWREVVHHRRSAVAMDGRTSMAREDFLAVLRRTLHVGVPFDLFAKARVDLALFVHRVEDLERGLYLLVRDPSREPDLRAALRASFDWEPVEPGLPLVRLHAGDLRGLAARISCQQSIAGEGCFSLGMLADLGDLERLGPALYPRLFHETGAIGQALYLEAEALNLRGTGIGCFFDDEMHGTLGLATTRFQSLYHFALGAPVEDARLTTLPAYD